MSEILNALNRLQRAGSEASRCTAKLHEAAAAVAEEICESVSKADAIGKMLPRKYIVHRQRSNIGSTLFLYWIERETKDECDYEGRSHCINGESGYLHGDFKSEMTPKPRAGSLQFAKDVSEGLLDEIAEFLEKRAAENELAAQKLEAAK